MKCLSSIFRLNSNLMRRRRVPGLSVKTSAAPSGAIGTGDITVTSPVPYQVIQRGVGGQGALTISGTYTGTPGAMEASFAGGGWTRLCDAPTAGVFGGTIANQDAGQGTLQVRWIGNADSAVGVDTVGIGDVFVCAGQSNMVGMASSAETYSHATLIACLFGNDYVWQELADPYDTITGQVDTVSREAAMPGGSFVVAMASSYLASQGCPIAFVPCALGGSAMESWQPGANHQDRATLYGSMIYRALQTGARCVLWWQGEEDAVRATSEALYCAWLDSLADAIYADLGVPLMPCKIELLQHDPWVFSTVNVNNGIGTAWADNSNVLAGPDFSTIDWGTAHYDNAQVPMIAGAWWTAIRTAFGWGA